MVSVECQRGLRPQLEKMQLRSENLLRACNRGQVESVFHLLAAHCNGKPRRYRSEGKKATGFASFCKFTHQSELTFVKEASHSVPLQEIRVFGYAVHIGNCVVKIKHVLGRLLVPVDSGGVLHSKNLQQSLDGRRADFLWLVVDGEVILQAPERRSCAAGAHQCGEADQEHQHL